MTNNYYLRSGFTMSTAAGLGPKDTIDVKVKDKDGNPFMPFGTWNITY